MARYSKVDLLKDVMTNLMEIVSEVATPTQEEALLRLSNAMEKEWERLK